MFLHKVWKIYLTCLKLHVGGVQDLSDVWHPFVSCGKTTKTFCSSVCVILLAWFVGAWHPLGIVICSTKKTLVASICLFLMTYGTAVCEELWILKKLSGLQIFVVLIKYQLKTFIDLFSDNDHIIQFLWNRIWKFVLSHLFCVVFLMFRLWHIFGKIMLAFFCNELQFQLGCLLF